MFDIISSAIAAEAATPSQSQSMLSSFGPLVLIMFVFYFLLIRPQQKRAKQHQNMLSQISKGDKVVTAGGILGTVSKVEDNFFVVEIAENVKIKVKKDTVSEILNEQPKAAT